MTPVAQQETKTCRYCAESIPVNAKLCPRCRQWLSLRSFRNPAVIIFAVFLPLVGSYFLLVWGALNRFQKVFNPPPYYFESRGSLRVVESKMSWTDTADGRRVFVTGIVTNQSSAAWAELEFDVRFFNANGQMIDAANGRTAFAILPGNDSAFRVSVLPLVPSNEYSSFKISVSNAKNIKGAF